MRKLSQRWVGLDVHADTIVVAVAEETGNPAVLETVRTTQELLKVSWRTNRFSARRPLACSDGARRLSGT